MRVRQKHGVRTVDMKWLIRPWLLFLSCVIEEATKHSSTTSCPFLQPLIKSIKGIFINGYTDRFVFIRY